VTLKDDLKLLFDTAPRYGIQLSDHQLNLYRIYLDELWEWNRRINLTGLHARKKIAIELCLDSLIPAPFIPEKGRMLDVGSGAGFPGVPLKIHSPGLKTHLIEANSKKVSFLRHVIRLLKLNEIEVIKGRIERDGILLHPSGYRLITARALADLRQTVAWCAPFLSSGGLLLTFLGSGAEKDLEKGRQVMEKYGIRPYRKIPYFLPGRKSLRNTMIFKKE
jgi:16S rRNA (guanine527-N7)-methyltransferase